MRVRYGTTFFAMFVLLSWAVIPCQAADRAAVSPQGTLKLAIHWTLSADWFDPSLPSFAQQGVSSLYLVHDALLKPMPGAFQSPSLAESWTISPDARVYEFKLRKGVKFHNGDEMTAEDVVFTISRYKGNAAKQVKDRIDKVEAVNPYLVRVTFKAPFPNFLEYFITGECTIGWIVPKKYIEKVGDAEYRRKPIGCGPYKFVEFTPGVGFVAEAFDGFWRKTPHVKRMEFNIVGEMSTRYAMVKRGDVDIATLMIDVFYQRVKKDSDLRLMTPESPTRNIVEFTSQWDPKSPWSDARVRKAASLAVDRQALADVHMPGCVPVGELSLPGEPEGITFPPDPYDPERARKLLADAGYPKGFQGGIFYPWDGPYWPFCEQVANYWKAIGITVDTVLLDKVAFLAKRRSGGMKGTTFIETFGQPTIATRLEYLFGGIQGGGSYGNYPDIQELWEKYNKAFDPRIRKDLIGQIQKLMHERTMVIHFTSFNSPAAFGPKVKGNPYRVQKPYPMWFILPFEDIELN
jgi:peptide/nickel transport system substrate-binding protein